MTSVLMPGEVLAALEACPGPVTAAELARRFGVHVLTVAAVLSCLEDQGKARPVGASGMPRGTGTRRWVVA